MNSEQLICNSFFLSFYILPSSEAKLRERRDHVLEAPLDKARLRYFTLAIISECKKSLFTVWRAKLSMKMAHQLLHKLFSPIDGNVFSRILSIVERTIGQWICCLKKMYYCT